MLYEIDTLVKYGQLPDKEVFKQCSKSVNHSVCVVGVECCAVIYNYDWFVGLQSLMSLEMGVIYSD